jgi:hypothetical protein
VRAVTRDEQILRDLVRKLAACSQAVDAAQARSALPIRIFALREEENEVVAAIRAHCAARGLEPSLATAARPARAGVAASSTASRGSC